MVKELQEQNTRALKVYVQPIVKKIDESLDSIAALERELADLGSYPEQQGDANYSERIQQYNQRKEEIMKHFADIPQAESELVSTRGIRDNQNHLQKVPSCSFEGQTESMKAQEYKALSEIPMTSSNITSQISFGPEKSSISQKAHSVDHKSEQLNHPSSVLASSQSQKLQHDIQKIGSLDLGLRR